MGRRRDFRGARCLITGASSGLGEAIALLLAREGARLVLTGRSEDRLARVRERAQRAASPEASILAVAADLTRAEDLDRLFVAVDNHLGALDLVVNAAGVGAYGRFESHDSAVLRQIVEINLIALAEVCRRSLPLLRQGDRASLVNIGSVVARRGLPGRAEYSASKFAVAGLTEALRAEWTIDGIHVLQVNPGFTTTAFEQNLVANTAIYQTPHLRSMTADQVADAVLHSLLRRKNEVTLTWLGRLLLGFNRISPRFVDWGLGRWAKRLYANVDQLARAESRP
jgi:short-subunit dehydrogenase